MEQTAFLAPPQPPSGPDLLPPDNDLFGLWKFEVRGEAVPQGSMVPFISKYDGKARLKPSNEKELKAWRKTVADTALLHRPPWLREPWDGPVYAAFIYIRERSQNDYLADGVTLSKGARRYPDTAPDKDKLDRAMFDALTGVAFTNDGRVVSGPSVKRFAGPGEKARVLADIGFLRS